ncbi:hypothetical protein IJF86_01080 [Candidatus Saccharibacteria bacterium]|nr:hypothetical protein [Candidatus Saccharibacteria bacterium]
MNSSTQPSVSSIIDPPKPAPEPEKKHSGLGQTIAIAILSVTTVAFAGLFVWKLLDWIDASTNLDAQISAAVAVAVNENSAELEAEFAEREKDPYTAFAGPADYGELSFSYPKTWSLYVSKDAANGGDYESYMNPGGVEPISPTTVMALRVQIKTQTFDNIIKTYDSYVKNGKMTMSVVNVNNGAATANVYRGTLQSGLVGIVAVMKIRDKTAIIQTDSELFAEEFDKIITSLTFNS